MFSARAEDAVDWAWGARGRHQTGRYLRIPTRLATDRRTSARKSCRPPARDLFPPSRSGTWAMPRLKSDQLSSYVAIPLEFKHSLILLLASQMFHRIDRRSAARGHIAGEQSRKKQDRGNRDDGQQVMRFHTVKVTLQQTGGLLPDDESDDYSDCEHYHRLANHQHHYA